MKRGYVFIEVLVASALLSLAGTGLYAGLMQGLKAERVIRGISQTNLPLRIFWKRLEKDLRNSVSLRDTVYVGKKDEMSFPVAVKRLDKGKSYLELRKIRYFVKDGVLKRRDEELSTRLAKEKPNERVVLKSARELEFQYAYLDEKEKLLFRPFWLEEPYFGIPIAVKVEVKLNGREYSKLVSVPHGRWGRVQPDE